MRNMVYVQENGTAAVVVPIETPGESEAETHSRVAAELGLTAWEAVSPEVVAALRRADQPVPGAVVSVAEFRNRLIPAYLVLPTKDAATQAKWTAIIRDFLPADRGLVDLTSPAVKLLVQAAAADGLLQPAEAAAALHY